MRVNKKKIKIAIYENLPTGGAKNLYESNYKFLKENNIFFVRHYNIEPDPLAIKNIIQYFRSINSIDKQARLLANEINNSFDVAIVYHSWITKSPILLRYLRIPSIYICHEPPREFYDESYIKLQNIKEKIVNLFRYKFKKIDSDNVFIAKKNSILTVISNSFFSKKIIDDVYKINSHVVYPGTMQINKKVTPFEQRENMIISVGSINKLKNQASILKDISKLNPITKNNLKIVFIGNGGNYSYISKLLKFSKKEKLNLQIFTNLSNEKLSRFYLKSKIFMFGAINEPFGLVVLEAMKYGLPVISTFDSSGGYQEILNGKNADIDIEELIINKKKWLYLSKTNKFLSHKYSLLKMNEQLKKIILNLVNYA